MNCASNWVRTKMDGLGRTIKTETGNGTTTVWLPFTNEPDKISFDSSLIHGAFALFHVHPNGTLPDLSPKDMALADKNHLDVFSESSQGLFDYNSADKSDTQVADNLQWTKPCQYK